VRDEEHAGRPAIAPSGALEAVRALLRARALEQGLLSEQQDEAGVTAAIEALLDQEVVTPEPTDEECSRFYATHIDRFSSGDLVYARHILFAVTAGAPLQAIRAKAEETLLTLQREPARFEALARECSNCSSGASGGNLGQLTRDEIVPEFAAAVFDSRRTGLLSSLVRTRYGFHIVAIDQRVAGQSVPFEAVRERIATELRELVQERALRQYVQVLAGRTGVEIPGLDSARTPLVQ
jgi:peptidyl-prolyl cis-trans isomerase C